MTRKVPQNIEFTCYIRIPYFGIRIPADILVSQPYRRGKMISRNISNWEISDRNTECIFLCLYLKDARAVAASLSLYCFLCTPTVDNNGFGNKYNAEPVSYMNNTTMQLYYLRHEMLSEMLSRKVFES